MKLSCMALDVVQNAVGEESLDPGGTKGMEVGEERGIKLEGMEHQAGHCAFHCSYQV